MVGNRYTSAPRMLYSLTARRMGNRSPNIWLTRVEMAIASQGQRIPLPNTRNQPVM